MRSVLTFVFLAGAVWCQCSDPAGYSGITAKLGTGGKGYKAESGVGIVYNYTVAVCEGLDDGTTPCRGSPVWACMTFFDRESHAITLAAGSGAGGGSGRWMVSSPAHNVLRITGTGGALCINSDNHYVATSIVVTVTCGSENSGFKYVNASKDSCVRNFAMTSPAACYTQPSEGSIVFGPPSNNETAFFGFKTAVACLDWQAQMVLHKCTTDSKGCTSGTNQVRYTAPCSIPVSMLAKFRLPYYAAIDAPAQSAFEGELAVGMTTTNVTLSYHDVGACMQDFHHLNVLHALPTDHCDGGREIVLTMLPDEPVGVLNNITALNFTQLSFSKA